MENIKLNPNNYHHEIWHLPNKIGVTGSKDFALTLEAYRPGSFSNDFDALIKGIEVNDFIIDNYVSEPTIKFPLSN